MEFNKKNTTIFLLVISLITYLYLGFGLGDRSNIVGLYTAFGILFGCYAWVSVNSGWSEQQLHRSAILFRLMLFFSFPVLSDDVYRFVWDGRLLAMGENPFLHLPSHYLNPENAINGLNQTLFDKLNSPEYFTIYPPVNQGIFYLAAKLSPNSLYFNTILLKLPILLAEIGTLWLLPKLLKHLQLPTSNALWYSLNPLVIVELSGNVHFEGIMIFFLLFSFWLLLSKRWLLSAIMMALSICTKLLPLMFLPFFIRRMGWKNSFLYFSVIGVTTLVLFLPFYDPLLIENFSNSLELYFKKFEFNASIYYIVRWIGYQLVDYNVIGKVGGILSLVAAGIILLIALFERKSTMRNLPLRMLSAQGIYYLFTVIVHPWYLSTLLALSVFTRYRFMVIWSGSILLSYYTYRDTTYTESLSLVVIEYTAVAGWLLYELIRKKEGRQSAV